VLFPLFAALALLTFAPSPRRGQVAVWIERRPRLVTALVIALGSALLVNGLARILWIVLGQHRSIW